MDLDRKVTKKTGAGFGGWDYYTYIFGGWGVRYLGRLAHPKSYQLNANFPIQHVFVGSV